MNSQTEFSVLPGRLCLAKLPPTTDIASLAGPAPFFSLTVTDDEVSIVADESFSYPGAEVERGWRGIKLKGPLDFALKGVLASILNPLNEAEVSVFVVSTYSTDYIFVQGHSLDRAVAALEAAGHCRLKESDARWEG